MVIDEGAAIKTLTGQAQAPASAPKPAEDTRLSIPSHTPESRDTSNELKASFQSSRPSAYEKAPADEINESAASNEVSGDQQKLNDLVKECAEKEKEIKQIMEAHTKVDS